MIWKKNSLWRVEFNNWAEACFGKRKEVEGKRSRRKEVEG